MGKRWWVGVDVGGTFTDFYAVDLDTRQVVTYKRPSTPHNPGESIIDGLEDLNQKLSVASGDIVRFCHGTTVGTNALIQRGGGEVTVVTTQGFGDLLEIGRQTRPHMFDVNLDHPSPLADAEHRFEVIERLNASGEVVTPLDPDSVEAAVDAIASSDAKACAVCFLFAYLNGEHERYVRDQINQRLPEIHVSLSSEVQPEFREFERFSTTTINAFLQPVMADYIASLHTRINAIAPRARLGINQSSGGLMSMQQAERFPVRTALSGPAAGIVGAIQAATQAGTPNVITLDMGGTSADVAIIHDGHCAVSFDRVVAGFPIRLPMLDIDTVGAGGGSIAWIERDGLLKVGPRSAGADPGPACYGRGGQDATVTDANLVLGRLSSGGLLGGTMSLDENLARASFDDVVAKTGLSLMQCARGVIDVVVSNMVRAVRTVSVQRGHDPRDYSLLAYGGAGPLHARDVAANLNMSTVVVPRAPGILCAQGLIVADLKEDFVDGSRTPLTDETLAVLHERTVALCEQAQVWFEAEHVESDQRIADLWFDMRYIGQNFELRVPVRRDDWAKFTGDDLRDSFELQSLIESFFAVHERSYGFYNPDDPIEVVNIRLSAIGQQVSVFENTQASTGDAVPLPSSQAIRSVVFDGLDAVPTPCFWRDDLLSGMQIEGPAIVDQLDATTLIYPGDHATVDYHLNLVIKLSSLGPAL